MPKFVDSEQRKRDIVDAAITTLSEGGFSQLTLRNMAKRMGGSITLITHYYKNRDELITGLLEQAFEDADQAIAGLASIEDPIERLTSTLEWFLPLDPKGLMLERARIALLAHRDVEPAVDDFIRRLEPAMRGVIARGVEGHVEPEEMEVTVDLLRSWVSGIALSAVEHPEIWTAERQLRALGRFLRLLSLPTSTQRLATI